MEMVLAWVGGVEDQMKDACQEDDGGGGGGGFEVDFDYEFDAARWFDLGRRQMEADARQSEGWFAAAPSYPPFPFMAKISIQNNFLPGNINTSPKLKDVAKEESSNIKDLAREETSDITVDLDIEHGPMCAAFKQTLKHSDQNGATKLDMFQKETSIPCRSAKLSSKDEKTWNESQETVHKVKPLPLNKWKIFPSTRDIGVGHYSKRKDTKPMEFNFAMGKRCLPNSPTELFKKLAPDLQKTSASRTKFPETLQTSTEIILPGREGSQRSTYKHIHPNKDRFKTAVRSQPITSWSYGIR